MKVTIVSRIKFAVTIISRRKFADGTIAVSLSNGRVHCGKPDYLRKLLKQRYNILLAILLMVFAGCSKTQNLIIEDKVWVRTVEVYIRGPIKEGHNPPKDAKILEHDSHSDFVYKYDWMSGDWRWQWETIHDFKYQEWELGRKFTISEKNTNPKDPTIPEYNQEISKKSNTKYIINTSNDEFSLLCNYEQYSKIQPGDTIKVWYRNNNLVKFEKINSETIDDFDF